MKQYLALLLGLTLALPLEANQTPQGLHSDQRLKVVRFDENNVVHIEATFGFATTIELEKGEYVIDKSSSGKEAGWEVKSDQYSHLINIKPLLQNNSTNINFATNKGRLYTLFLTTSEVSINPTFRVRFIYPKTQALPGLGVSDLVLSRFAKGNALNEDYSFWGDKTIAPIVAKDDGRFTLLRFKPGAPIPAILAVDLKTKKESLVNYRLEGGYVVIEGVYPQYSFRLGEHVTCLFNDRAIKAWKQEK